MATHSVELTKFNDNCTKQMNKLLTKHSGSEGCKLCGNDPNRVIYLWDNSQRGIFGSYELTCITYNRSSERERKIANNQSELVYAQTL